ncbi:ejaculatory bulb-specific protein 3-like [Choristoneura fumiferana]|uniref:ejaculatory bulb-specific protein 3-like n=1 Tax=Choristoneura fumiferana TaxID=7141 RepID=UPI003D15D9C4
MRIILFIILLVSSVLCQDYYDRRYDYFDVETLAQNPRLLKKYMECFLDRGPCTPVGRVFKRVLPEIIVTGCAKCSPSQRRFARRTFEAFKQYLPDGHTELKTRLDPSHKYYDNFEKKIANA